VKRTFVMLLAAASAGSALAQGSRDYADLLRKNGFAHCAPVVNRLANWLAEGEGEALSIWKREGADHHMGFMLLARKYVDGTVTMTISASRAPDGGCDLSFTQVVPMAESCAAVRDKTLPNWKYYSDMVGAGIYEDPTSDTVHALLVPSGSGCIVKKSGMLFYAAQDVADAAKP
jgi:hypothetical protein